MSVREGDELRSGQWRKIRLRVIANSTQCALCGQPLVPDAAPRTRWSTSVDHIVPRSLGGPTLPHNWRTSLRAVHYGCNSRRGNGLTSGKGSRKVTAAVQTSRQSRGW